MNVVLLAQSDLSFCLYTNLHLRIFTRTRRNGNAVMTSHWSYRDIQFR